MSADTVDINVQQATVMQLQRQILTVVSSRASNAMHGFNKRDGNGAYLNHMRKVNEMWRLWDMCKPHIPNNHHAKYERLMRSSDPRDLSVALTLAVRGRFKAGW